jgi:hypothetical protein
VIRLLLLISFTVFGASIAEARTFDFKTESFAAYFAGTYGTSRAGDYAYSNSVKQGATADKAVTGAGSGEFGFLIPGNSVSFKIGLEYLVPKELSEIAISKGSTKYSTVHSKLSALIPMVSFEIPTFTTATSRMITGFGAGMAFISMENQHVLTAAGKAILPSGDFTESASGSALAAHAYFGYEFLASDTATLFANLGYRYIKATSFKSTQKATTFTGSEQDGTEIKNIDGGVRGIDLSGAYAGIALRFYL